MYRLFAGMLATATLCVLAPTLHAADESKPADPKAAKRADGPEAARDEALFTELDKNHDGKLAADEVTTDHRRLFERLLRTADANDDGALDKGEFLAGMKERPEGPAPREGRGDRERRGPPLGDGRPGDRPFMRPGEGLMRLLDTDHDGAITTAEMQAAPAALKKLDRNDDGKITPDELAPPPGEGGPPRELGRRGPGGPDGPPPGAGGPAPRRGPEGRGPEGRGPDGRGPDGRRGPEGRGPDARGPDARGPGGPSPERFAERLKALDKNGDGKISKEEAEGPLQERFDRVDANHDGFLDQTELEQMRQRMRQLRPEGRPEGRRPAGEDDAKPATPEKA